MGYMRNHGILVSHWDGVRLKKAHTKAKEIFQDQVSEILIAPVNGISTFLVGPDGSKEGWDPSDRGDENRETFKAWMKAQAAKHGYDMDWVEVQYGDDERETKITEHSDQHEYEDS